MKRLAAIAAACVIAVPAYAQTVATVNGQDITQKNLDGFVALLVSQGATDSDELRQQVKQEMIHRLVAVQAAEKAGADKQEAVQQELELARQGILVRALMSNHLDNNPISDAEIKVRYDELKEEQSKVLEYKVRHILVEDEKQAQDLISAISSKKTTFEEAAKQDSIDPGSGANGGDLGWSPAGNYVPEFAQAVESLDKGAMTDAPVQSQFGWHIIQVEDTRPTSFPEFEAVKPQLEEMLRQQQLAEFQDELMKNAKITQ